MTLRLVTVVGARPEFVQVGPIARSIRATYAPPGAIEHAMVHTGQHYDENMSQAFFDQLGLPDPVSHLGVGPGSQGAQTGEMLGRLDPVLQALAPDVVMVFGDTNSTLAGALAAAKLKIPLAHVESGLRSFNSAMPEEINRKVTDHVASILFCPSETAVSNLAAEGVTKGVHLTGDVMYESLLHALSLGAGQTSMLARLGLAPGEYAVATTHRAENTDAPDRLGQILLGISDVARQGVSVIFPVHPRTRARMEAHLLDAGVVMIDPLPHLETVTLVQSAALLLTDSGGLQKEAYWLDTPCVTMRDETEWVETVDNGWNVLAGADRRRISKGAMRMMAGPLPERPPLYGEGTRVSSAILDRLLQTLGASTDAEAS
ncbi:MAG: UDP-N-acetylglucosamine 2-epimerase (non-hydrolyzing) [Acidimicrobiia bacterium]